MFTVSGSCENTAIRQMSETSNIDKFYIQNGIPSKCSSATYKELREYIDFYSIILPEPNVFESKFSI